MDVTWHNSHFAFPGRGDNARAIGAYQRSAHAAEVILKFKFIQRRDIFGNADHQLDTRIRSLYNGIEGKRGRNKD